MDEPLAAARQPVGPPPDVLVMDWEMPGLTGIEVCHYLRGNPATQALPVLLLTGHQDPEDVTEGLAAGANDYAFKPFRAGELRVRVHALVRWSRLHGQATAAHAHTRQHLTDETARRQRMLLFGDAILGRMSLHGQVLAQARTYIGIVGGFLFIQVLINVFSSLIRTYGFTKQSMYVSLGMNVLHVLGNYVLIFGHLGAPELGVAGAALSTVVSRSLALGVFVWMLYRVMEVRMAPRDLVTFSKEYVGKILKVGVPSALEQITYHACQTVFLYYVTFLGSVALASRQYAMAISHYVFLFSLAIGIGTSIIVGRLVGAERKEEAYRRVVKSLKWSVAITVLIDVVAIVLRRPLVGLFTHNPDIIALTAQVMVLSLLLESGRSFNLVLVNALRAAGDARFTVLMGFLSMVCMSLSLGYFLVFRLNLGLAGVWRNSGHFCSPQGRGRERRRHQRQRQQGWARAGGVSAHRGGGERARGAREGVRGRGGGPPGRAQGHGAGGLRDAQGGHESVGRAEEGAGHARGQGDWRDCAAG